MARYGKDDLNGWLLKFIPYVRKEKNEQPVHRNPVLELNSFEEMESESGPFGKITGDATLRRRSSDRPTDFGLRWRFLYKRTRRAGAVDDADHREVHSQMIEEARQQGRREDESFI